MPCKVNIILHFILLFVIILCTSQIIYWVVDAINKILDVTKNLLVKAKNTFITKSFLRFCILGCINCLNDAIFSHFANYFMQKNLAAVVGYMISLSLAFYLTSMFIFKSKPTFSKYYKFLLSYIPNFIIFFLVTFITINTWKLPQFVGTFLAAAAGGPITFIMIKLFAFGKKQ